MQNKLAIAEIDVSDVDYVRLSDFEHFEDGSGWRATIKVGAGEFLCSGRKFVFGGPRKFLDSLKKCNEGLNGHAELKTPFEDEFLRFSFENRGCVTITGLLQDYGGRERSFRFEIEADQTFVPGFIKSFEQAISSLKG